MRGHARLGDENHAAAMLAGSAELLWTVEQQRKSVAGTLTEWVGLPLQIL
jgi:hypothetical protein